jgi:hypothetical protein
VPLKALVCWMVNEPGVDGTTALLVAPMARFGAVVLLI